MSLDFLTPPATGAPPARGPLADAAAAAGAELAQRDGWTVAVSFGDPAAEAAAIAETVAFADLSHLTKLELQGDPAALAAALPGSDEGFFGPGGKDHSSSGAAGGWSRQIRPGVALVLCAAAEGEERRATLAAAAGVRVCDVTAGWGALAIAGPRSRDLFARFCALDVRDGALPVGGWRPGSIARTPGHLLRLAADRYLMLFGAAYGAYVWEVVADAAAPLRGRPVGLDALGELAPAGGSAARA